MPTVTFASSNISLEVEKGTLLSDSIKKAGLFLETPCNCMGLCGKCRVIAKGELSEPTAEEAALLEEAGDTRLACLARVAGDVEVELCSQEKELKTVESGYTFASEPVLFNTTNSQLLNVKKDQSALTSRNEFCYKALDSGIEQVELPGIDRSSSRPYMDSLTYKADSVSILRQLAELEAKGAPQIYGIVSGGRLLAASDARQAVLGVAVDIGTTGISSYLVDLQSSNVLNRLSCLNPQTQYGGDVLTRISYCMSNEDGVAQLREAIVNKVNELISKLTGEKYSTNAVYRVAVAGNTTMQHLFLGLNPIVMARAPYRPVFIDKQELDPSETGININPNGTVILLPSASGYVGADIIAGVAATEFYKRKKAALFIDIGTNGEIVAINGGRLAATSTAAGPALEGMNIACGCRAEEGAIDSFDIDEQLNISYTTVGGAEPAGICGSGLLDIAACMVRHGIVLKTGNFNSSMDERFKQRYRDKRFYITDKVYLTQKDIRQIQLAKGAIATGITMLLEEMGISLEHIEEVVIAGAFGYHINPGSIKAIGLIPKGFRGETVFVGNSSLEGARLALVNRDILQRMVELKNEMTVVELSTSESFQEYFIRELGF